jgi:3-oxoadipate enol-lactonase
MIDAGGCLLNVSVEGRDGGPTLMLSNSLGEANGERLAPSL